MMRTLVPVVLLAFLLPTIAMASGPNERTDPILMLGDTVVDAAIGAGNGWILAASQDPGSSLGGLPGGLGGPGGDADVWFLWEQDGDLVQGDDADAEDCLTTPGDLCKYPASAVALSGDGERFLVTSCNGTDGSCSGEAQILFGTGQQGVVGRLTSSDAVEAAFLDDDGGTAVLLFRVASGTGSDTARLESYTWANSVPTTPTWTYDLDVVPDQVALSQDGTRVVVAADDAIRIHNGAEQVAQGTTQAAVAVAVSDGADHPSVVVFDQGNVAVYDDVEPTVADWSRRVRQAAGTAAAITHDGSMFAAGFRDGWIHLYDLDLGDVPAAVEHAKLNFDATPIDDLTFSQDGRYLLVVAGDRLDLYSLTSEDPLLLWSDSRPDPIVAAGLDARGETVFAAHGEQVTVYEADHHVVGSPGQGIVPIKPGSKTNLTIQYTNDGNRPEDVRLTLDFPEGIAATVDPEVFSLDPGQKRNVQVQVIVGKQMAPGTYTVTAQHSLAEAAGFVDTDLFVEVPLVEDMRLVVDGARSKGLDGGGSAVYSLTVANKGNAKDDFTIQTVLSDPTWSLDVTPRNGSVAAGEEATVELVLSAPAGAEMGASATVQVYLAGVSERTVDLVGTVGAAFDISLQAQSGLSTQSGNQTTWTLTVRNEGNAVDGVDILLDTSLLPANWTAAFPSGLDRVTLQDIQPGKSVQTAVTITPPTDLAEEQTVSVGARATSLGDPTVTAQRTVLVTAEPVPQEEEKGDDGGDNGIPGLPVAGALVALAAAAVLRRH